MSEETKGPARSVAYLLSSMCVAIRNCQKSGNADWEQRHGERIAHLVRDYLPSGSGFDCGTKFDADKSTNRVLTFTTEFHHMNEGGYYDGWTSHVVRAHAGFDGFDLTVSGPDRNGIKDYIAETFHVALSQLVTP